MRLLTKKHSMIVMALVLVSKPNHTPVVRCTSSVIVRPNHALAFSFLRTAECTACSAAVTVWLRKVFTFVPDPKCTPVLWCKQLVVVTPENGSINRLANRPCIFAVVSPRLHRFCSSAITMRTSILYSLVIVMLTSTHVLRRTLFVLTRTADCTTCSAVDPYRLHQVPVLIPKPKHTIVH